MNNAIDLYFDKLSKNYNHSNCIKYYNFLSSLDKPSILDSFKKTFVVPDLGGKFINEFVATNLFSTQEINNMLETLDAFISNCELKGYDHINHVNDIKKAISLLRYKKENNTLNIDNYEYNSILSDYIFLQNYDKESYNLINIKKDIRDILDSVNGESRKINILEKILSSLYDDKQMPIYEISLGSQYIMLLSSIFLYTIKTCISCKVLDKVQYIISLIIHDMISQSNKKIYMLIGPCLRVLIWEQIKVEDLINTKNTTNIENLEKYSKFLSFNISRIKTIIELKTEYSRDLMLDRILSQKTRADKIEVTKEMVDVAYLDFIFNDDNDNIESLTESFETLISLQNILDGFIGTIITEGTKSDEIRKKVNVAANKVYKKSKKVSSHMKKSKEVSNAVSNNIKKVPRAIDDKVSDKVNKAKDAYRKEIREEIIEDKTRIRLTKLIRNGIAVGGATAVNPALGAITALVGYACKKKASEKERRKILKELNEELKIVEEKIEDARGDSNKEKKYQLMRIKNKLEKDIDRIQFRIKSDNKGV